MQQYSVQEVQRLRQYGCQAAAQRGDGEPEQIEHAGALRQRHAETNIVVVVVEIVVINVAVAIAVATAIAIAVITNADTANATDSTIKYIVADVADRFVTFFHITLVVVVVDVISTASSRRRRRCCCGGGGGLCRLKGGGIGHGGVCVGGGDDKPLCDTHQHLCEAHTNKRSTKVSV
jgi:hypothetical protein